MTLGADADLENIHSYYVGEGSGSYAKALLQKFAAKIDSLEQFPFRGNVPRELDALGIRDFRQVTIPPYRIVYQVVGDVVQILLVADGRRDMQALLEARLID
jgi:toxin ParE1/3/4